jgi:hypothetical protein
MPELEDPLLVHVLALLGAPTRLHALRRGPVEVMLGDPALIVRRRYTARRFRSGLHVDRLLLDGSLLRSGLRATGLREEGLDPGLVDEVEGTAENAREEEVEEDAVDTRLVR